LNKGVVQFIACVGCFCYEVDSFSGVYFRKNIAYRLLPFYKGQERA
jgi:hypothetical protein